MGHRQHMNPKQLLEWDSNSYKAKLAAQKGHNYEYWNDKHELMLQNGWELYQFIEKGYNPKETISEFSAKRNVDRLRKEGNFARIIVGRSKNKQRIKMHSIIYKKRKNK